MSLPSKKITIVDVPGVSAVSAQFMYNFFSPDESTNDSGVTKADALVRSGELGTSVLQDRVERLSPRAVRISFRPPPVNNPSGNEFITSGGSLSFGRGVGIEDFLGSIYSERDFSNGDFTALELQDTGLDGRLLAIVSGSVSSRVASIAGRSSAKTVSRLDMAKLVNSLTPKSVSGNFLIEALGDAAELGALVIDRDSASVISRVRFEDVMGFSLHAQVSNRLIGDVVSAVASDVTSVYSDEAAAVLKSARRIQAAAAAGATPDEVSLGEYEADVTPISYRSVPPASFRPRIEVIGFIVDKTVLASDGSETRGDPIIVNSPVSSIAFDTAIKYGTAYSYAVRTIALVEILASTTSTEETVAATFLVSSEPSSKMVVRCIEDVPPPPPTDIAPLWDYDTETMTLTWSYPVNTQRDVKRFQVFRRSTVSDPFVLLREFNFDDSEVKFVSGEEPLSDSVTLMRSPVRLFTDVDFTKDSRYIYSICSVDAHGMTSNYSAQVEASFDRGRNRIVRRLVSVSGAPKSYPNIMFSGDLFEDTIRTSGRSKLTLYFNPECIDVTGASGEPVGLLALSSRSGKYRLQAINTDVQKSASVDVTLKDVRT